MHALETPRSNFALIAVSAVLFIAAGCSENFFRSTTTLHPDGRVDRVIYQPADQTPDDAQKPSAWKSITYAPRLEPHEWSRGPAEFPPAARDEKHPYFAARGSFPSAAEIPAYFVRHSADGTRAGRLERNVTSTDYVFVIEHRWEETLTDVVTLEDMHAARRELADIGLTLATAVLEQGLGDEYDVSRVLAWLRTDGVAFLNDLTDIYYDAGVRRELKQPGVEETRFRKAAARYGLTRFENDAVATFARDKLRELLRRRDGKAVADEAIESLFTLELRRDPDAPAASPLQDVLDRAIQDKYDGPAALESRLLGIAARITGVYGPFRPPDRFEYELTMPGTIVETTGLLTSDRTVRWTFQASDAYPLGYRMTCRSLALASDLPRKLEAAGRLKTREAQIAYVDLLSQDADLLAAVQQCRTLESLAPLERHLIKVQQEGDAKSIAAAERLWKLLNP